MSRHPRALAACALLAAFALPALASAKAAPKPTVPSMPPDTVIGKVTAVTGDAMQVRAVTGATYAVDVRAARLAEAADQPALTVASILVGDSVTATGPVTGLTQAATAVSDASLASRTSWSGTVSGVSVPIVSVNLNGQKYDNHPVDVSAAVVTRNAAPAAATDIRVGAKVTLFGTMDGAQINATAVKIGAPKAAPKKKPAKVPAKKTVPKHKK
jgi:hypothetical protein